MPWERGSRRWAPLRPPCWYLPTGTFPPLPEASAAPGLPRARWGRCPLPPLEAGEAPCGAGKRRPPPPAAGAGSGAGRTTAPEGLRAPKCRRPRFLPRAHLASRAGGGGSRWRAPRRSRWCSAPCASGSCRPRTSTRTWTGAWRPRKARRSRARRLPASGRASPPPRRGARRRGSRRRPARPPPPPSSPSSTRAAAAGRAREPPAGGAGRGGRRPPRSRRTEARRRAAGRAWRGSWRGSRWPSSCGRTRWGITWGRSGCWGRRPCCGPCWSPTKSPRSSSGGHRAAARFPVFIEEKALNTLAYLCDGDARTGLNGLQLAVQARLAAGKTTPLNITKGGSADGIVITEEHVKEGLQRSHILYDRAGEEHYNCISALHKSMRGSDENASLYWLARMLEGGEDPLYVARRLVRFASEDIGLADPLALTQAVAAYQGCHFIGMPECEVILAQCVVYFARAPKSIEVYRAYNNVKECLRMHTGPLPPVPLHLRNAPTRLMKNLGYGKGYKYNPMYKEPVDQDYLPEELKGTDFFKERKT
ncbi:ATPase WRNIP1 isoform 2-T2 [Morphnus guianensis]